MDDQRLLPKKVIFIRLDKIGDLVATLPMDEACRHLKIPSKWVIAETLGFLADNADPKRNYITLSLRKSWSSFWKLVDFLHSEKPSMTIIFYAPWWASLACFWAGVPMRAGRRSKLHSFLFFNKALRQSRSLSEKHEAEYNWELTRFAIGYQWFKNIPNTPVLSLKPPELPHLLKDAKLTAGQYVVIHVGMAGSALNWTEANYNSLIEKVLPHCPVVFTGTAADEKWLRPFKNRWGENTEVRWLQGKLSLQDLLYVLKNAHGVVAPSTGIIHLAAALGTISVGLYSPILAHHPVRWAPRGRHAIALLPSDVNCPAETECLGTKCAKYYCMKFLSPNAVMVALFG